MIRFGTAPRRTHSAISGRDRMRLLVLVLTLGLVILAMGETRKPERWRWLWAGAVNQGVVEPPADRAPSAVGETALLETDIAAAPGRGENLPEGVFVSRPPANPPAAEGLFPGVDPALLSTVEDHTFFQSGEHAAWFHQLSLLADQDQAELDRQAEVVGFVEVFQQPDAYRGRLVQIRGSARRAVLLDAPANELGIEDYYQVVLRPAGGPDSPIFVYCLSLPEEFPTGDSIAQEVSVSGLFFKNLAYRTSAAPGEGPAVLSAPTLVAKSIRWTPATTVIEGPRKPLSLVAISGLVVLSAVIGVAMARFLSRRTTLSVLPRNAHSSPEPDALAVADALARLAADHASSPDEDVEENAADG